MHQLFWMLFMGIPMVGLVHVAIGSFLSLQAYYGSTFVDGTGAVVGVGLLRNLGGIMSGMTFAGILAARMIPELRDDEPPRVARARPRRPIGRPDRGREPRYRPSAIPAQRSTRAWTAWLPRVVAAAAIACILLTLWGITVGTVVGWKASESLMGLSTEMFFMMMLKMMWFRDVLGLVVKGVLFGALPAAICCFEGLCHRPSERRRRRPRDSAPRPSHGLAPPCERAGFPRRLPVDGRDPDHELELVHAGVSRGSLLRPDIIAAALDAAVERRGLVGRRSDGGSLDEHSIFGA